MDKTTLIIVASFILLTIILLIVILIIKNQKKRSISKAIDKLNISKNMIISSSLISELSKSEKLINNKKTGKKVDEWKKKYNEITNIDIDNITNALVELDNNFYRKNYKECDKEIIEIEQNIFHIKAKCNNLLESIKDLTESESRNREAITKLKSVYRDIVFKYNKNKNDYKEVSNSIDLQFENIDKLFSGFEVAVTNKEYEEIGKIVKVLDDMINNIGIVIDEAPTVVMLSKIILPKKMNDIKSVADKMIQNGYNLEYLNLDYNISETNKKISEIMDRLNVLNLENSIFDLKTLSDYYENIYNDFEKEKNSKINFEKSLVNVTQRINTLSTTIRNLYSEIDVLKDTYDLTDEEIETIDNINKDLIETKESFKLINDRTLIRKFPYTRLDNECELVKVKVSKVEDMLELTLKNLGSLKEDESRARDQLSEIKIIIDDSKHKIKEYNLPIVPNKFYVQLKEANDAVNEIKKELLKKPISINTLNLRVDTARDLALKLYQTSKGTISNATMAETAIVYGNRYRSTYKEIEDYLNSATKLFYKGDYKSSLEVVLNALNIVEPGIYKRLLKGDDL